MLRDREALIYELRYVEEWRLREIADHLEISVPRVSQLLEKINNAVCGLQALDLIEEKLLEDPRFLELEPDWIRW